MNIPIDSLFLKVDKLTKSRQLCCRNINANWVLDLQEILEEAGIPLEVFCDTPSELWGEKPFTVKNGRLRLVYKPGYAAGVDIAGIKRIFKNLQS